MARCLARRELDELVCHKCGIRWDKDEPTPSSCQANVAGVQTPVAPMQRLLDALDMADLFFAKEVGVPVSSIRMLCRIADKDLTPEHKAHPAWKVGRALLTKRLAVLMAARDELNLKGYGL